jgi:capsular polysaccharide transport system permease protein
MTIWTKQSPPTRLPETASGLDSAGWAEALARPPLLVRLRGLLMRNAFKVTVLLPTLLTALYFFLVAAPQFDSEAHYLVKGRSGGGGGGGALAEMAASAGFAAASGDSLAVRDYLQSHDAVAALRERLPIVEMFRRPEADPVARLWWADPNAERLLDYYRRMVTAEYDSTSGITALRVRAFRPADTQAMAQVLLTLSEELVNRLNQRMLADGLRVAHEEVGTAEARLTRVQLAITGFREREKAVDPTRTASITLDNIGRLDGALAQSRAELVEAQRFSRGESPRVVQLQNRIAALQEQVVAERARVSSGEVGLSQQIGEFERLNVERELARGQLASATASLERARVDAQRQQIFLQRVVEPNLPEYARYPKATLTVLYVFLCLSVVYGLAWLLIAGMREHAS